jgi:DNA repair protein SbcC/Rad50
MRPVLLEMNGFACFRDHTVIDFTDADYFALVGPTGSGKSTILDAITFALYGTAYRWGRDNAVADALAPSANRCTVALTFDVGGHRYQVAREVRRGGGATQLVTQRNVSMVRFADPTVVEPDPDGPQPDVLAGEIKELRPAVEDLLGLDFNEFCHCVVVPQGQFARFLTASGPERNQILLKLLGATHYAQISRLANARAARAKDAVEIYTGQLEAYADATPEAEQEAQSRVSGLRDLVNRVDELVPRILESAQRARAFATSAVQLSQDVERLTAFEAPSGIGELQQANDRAQAALEAARQDADAASEELEHALQQAQAGPERTTVELAQARHTERAELKQHREELVTAADDQTEAARRAGERLSKASEEETQARQAAEEATTRLDTANRQVEHLAAGQTRLNEVHTPAGVAELAHKAAKSVQQTEQARSRANETRRGQDEAGANLRAAGDPTRLVEARETTKTLGETRVGLADALKALEAAREAALRAERSAQTATQEDQQARLELDRARVMASAAALRPHLEVGHECPVCAQIVKSAPPPLNDATLTAAEHAAAETAQRVTEERDAGKQAEREMAGAERHVDTLTERAEQLDRRLAGLLPERPTGQERDLDADLIWLETQEKHLRELESDAVQASTTRQKAEEVLEAAEQDAAVVAAELSQGLRVLHTLIGTLADLHPPAIDDSELQQAWRLIEDWASERGARLTEELAVATTKRAEEKRQSDDLHRRLKDAQTDRQRAQEEHTDAVRVAALATTERDHLLERMETLKLQLADAPTIDEIPGLLSQCTRLEQAVETKRARSRKAQTFLENAGADARHYAEQAKIARDLLTRTRYEFAAFAPPSLDLDDLASAWATLLAWAATEADRRSSQALAEAQQAEAASHECSEALRDMHQGLVDHGLDIPELGLTAHDTVGPEAGLDIERAARAAEKVPPLVATALAEAKADKEAVSRRLREATKLRGQIAINREQHQVAAQLADLTSSRKFQQWLADSARESLVTGASETLRELSSGQFDLTHSKGEFFVIDHADADLTRSVKTLSGGETFQASLALALALSNHLVGMGGATKLESIFLDEGFGTLDPEALEVVAATLDQLSSGDRTVGIITHVGALAERVPVRFHVRRNSRTSTVERESL